MERDVVVQIARINLIAWAGIRILTLLCMKTHVPLSNNSASGKAL